MGGPWGQPDSHCSDRPPLGPALPVPAKNPAPPHRRHPQIFASTADQDVPAQRGHFSRKTILSRRLRNSAHTQNDLRPRPGCRPPRRKHPPPSHLEGRLGLLTRDNSRHLRAQRWRQKEPTSRASLKRGLPHSHRPQSAVPSLVRSLCTRCLLKTAHKPQSGCSHSSASSRFFQEGLPSPYTYSPTHSKNRALSLLGICPLVV